eukprot:1394335-Amorphochlora_amoeboformis.AAC.1
MRQDWQMWVKEAWYTFLIHEGREDKSWSHQSAARPCPDLVRISGARYSGVPQKLGECVHKTST